MALTRRGVVLARGLGSRMRAADPHAVLTAAQTRAADSGAKAMMPVNGRPFLDYVLSALADAGVEEVALVVAPDDVRIREYYGRVAPPSRIHLDYVVQTQALGTAHAVTAAERWCGAEPFLTLNSDNLYPVSALRAVAGAGEPALAAFSREGLVASSNIPAERIAAFAVLEVDTAGYLTRIVEKPDRPLESPLVSMNLWRFDARIFAACRAAAPSRRGEFELPDAVSIGMSWGVRFRAVPARGPVLDLSTRGDAADVERRLGGWTPRP